MVLLVMRKALVSLAVFLTVAAGIAAEINLTAVSESVDFFGAKGGVGDNMVFFGFFGGGFVAILVVIAIIGLIFYKQKYSSKEGGSVREQEMFGKYNY